jgi:putative transposase
MNNHLQPQRSRPPYNPGLRDLVAGKRRWSPPIDREYAKRGFRSWHERGYLPHRDEPGLIQLVTFHLVDSFPSALRAEWAALLEVEDNQERRQKLEAYLDRGRGECHLLRPEIGQVVEEAIRHHHGLHYELRAWVVMPNHVHVLFKVGKKPMGQTVADWKEYTSRKANQLLNRRGHFWAKDFWDTYMRDSEHEMRACRYIELNPVRAFLGKDARAWSWTSARFRDEYGRFCF